MTLQSKYQEDKNGNKYAPITTPNAVRWPNGDNLEDKLNGKTDSSSLATVATSGNYNDLNNKPPLNYYYPETTTIPNVTSVGSASTWGFAMGTGNDEHTLIISGGNGSAPSLGTAKTVATGKLTNDRVSELFALYTSGYLDSGGSND